MPAIESESFIFGVGRVVVSGAKLEYQLHGLVSVLMRGHATEDEIEKVTGWQFTGVARETLRLSRRHLSNPGLVMRVREIVERSIPLMDTRGRLAHSPYLIDVNAAPGDAAVHTRTGEILHLKDGELDDLADKLDLLSVHTIEATKSVIAASGHEETVKASDLGDVIISRVGKKP